MCRDQLWSVSSSAHRGPCLLFLEVTHAGCPEGPPSATYEGIDKQATDCSEGKDPHSASTDWMALFNVAHQTSNVCSVEFLSHVFKLPFLSAHADTIERVHHLGP